MRPPRGGVKVFAVDDGVVQIERDRRLVEVAAADVEHPAVAPPPGKLVTKVATISDLHIGEPGFGVLPRIHPTHLLGGDHYSVRAARAAIDEAVAWGAELVVAKGDLTWTARPGQWELVAEVLAASPVPVIAVVGNHDVNRRGSEGRRWLEAAGVSTIVDRHTPVASVDAGPLRIVLAHTNSEYHGPARIDAGIRRRVLDALAAVPAGGGSMLVTHHYPNRFPLTTRYPAGIRHDDAAALFDTLSRLDRPPTLVTCGHSHRNRRYRRSGIDVSEVGSTKDYAGVWAGYAVHEGGIRQVVRRIAEPSVVEWIERTKRSCFGLWGEWTPGRLRWRCFSLPWR